VLARLHEEIAKAVATPVVRQRLANLGVIPQGNAPAAFKPFVADQVRQIAAIVKAAGIEPQ
jgi:tripartite-type tricarboxylate transporter receptor subunit TctC